MRIEVNSFDLSLCVIRTYNAVVELECCDFRVDGHKTFGYVDLVLIDEETDGKVTVTMTFDDAKALATQIGETIADLES